MSRFGKRLTIPSSTPVALQETPYGMLSELERTQ